MIKEAEGEKAVVAPPPVQNKAAALVSDTFVPHNMVELKEMATFLASSDLIPKSLNGRKENVAIVLMLGHEIGVPGVAALSNIYVVNGRPTIWGDLATALVRRSAVCEKLSYKFEGMGATLTCIATGKRKNDEEIHTVTYSWEDAKLAGNTEKDTYKKNPKDMLMWRALHRLFKFLWPDVLKGLDIREVVQDGVIDISAETIVVENPQQLPESQRVAEIKPENTTAAPAPTTEEVEALRQKKAAEFAASKEEATVKEPKPPADEKPDTSGLYAEAEIEPPAAAPAPPTTRIFGTVEKCVKKGDLYALIIVSAAGKQKYAITYEAACDIKAKFYGKTLEIQTTPLSPANPELAGKVLKYDTTTVEW